LFLTKKKSLQAAGLRRKVWLHVWFGYMFRKNPKKAKDVILLWIRITQYWTIRWPFLLYSKFSEWTCKLYVT